MGKKMENEQQVQYIYIYTDLEKKGLFTMYGC